MDRAYENIPGGELMRITINCGNGYFSIRMDRNVIADRLLLKDGHDRPLRTIFGLRSGLSISCVGMTWEIRGCEIKLHYKHEHDEHSTGMPQ